MDTSQPSFDTFWESANTRITDLPKEQAKFIWERGVQSQADQQKAISAQLTRLKDALGQAIQCWEYDGVSPEHGSVVSECKARVEEPLAVSLSNVPGIDQAKAAAINEHESKMDCACEQEDFEAGFDSGVHFQSLMTHDALSARCDRLCGALMRIVGSDVWAKDAPFLQEAKEVLSEAPGLTPANIRLEAKVDAAREICQYLLEMGRGEDELMVFIEDYVQSSQAESSQGESNNG